MKKYIHLLTALLLLTACNPNTPSAISVKGKIYKHPTAVQYLKFKTDSVLYYGNFGNEALSNHTFAYSQKDEVVTVYTPAPEHLLAYEGFVLRGDTIYELFADASDPSYQDHQPADPKAFSLIGKRYATTPDADNWSDTLEFVDKNKVLEYSLKLHQEWTYVLDYPQLLLGKNTHMIFTDTTTIFCKSLERTYVFIPE